MNCTIENFPKSKQANIQLWRVLACLGVFTVHLGQRMELTGKIGLVTNFGLYGVYLFFIISGFLAFCSSDLHEHRLKKYWLKRAIRILPLYYLSIIYFFITETFIFKDIPVDETGLGWWRYIFLTAGNVWNQDYFWSNLGITWTIFVFAMFYLLVPLANLFVKSYRSAWFLCTLMYLLSYGLRTLHIKHLGTLNYMVYFALGIMLYFSQKERKNNITLVVVSILMISETLLGKADGAFNYSLIFIILLISTMDITIRNKSVQYCLDVLDKYSFTLYLGQGIIYCGIIDKLKMRYNLSKLGVFLIAVIGTIILSYIVYNYFEMPFQRACSKIVAKSNSVNETLNKDKPT